MKTKTYILKRKDCNDCKILTSKWSNELEINGLKEMLRDIVTGCVGLISKNQMQFGDEWEVIDKAHDLMQQLFDEIQLEDI